MNLDFISHNTQELTHGFHPYPAKMIPQVAGKLIEEFGKKSKILLDPYCGTGTSLVEANLKNIRAIGSDLNPLARLIAKVKTTIIEDKTLELYLKDFHNHIFEIRFNPEKFKKVITPKYSNIDFWFSKPVKKDLTLLRNYIDTIDNINVKDFFLVAFSQTIRTCSWTRNDEFKLYKMEEEKIRYFKPDVFTTVENILARNRDGLACFAKIKTNKSLSKISGFNSILGIPQKIIKDTSIDIVVTSPPYGDSSTTVAYGQFSALANQWIFNMEKPRGLDKELMGGIKAKELITFKHSEVLNEEIKRINRKDKERALDVISFYDDYYKSIKNVSKKIRRKGFACYVVSNRNVRGVTLSTNQITMDFFQSNGFSHIDTFERKITNKRLPKKNSPSGKEGKKSSLMNTEHVIIMQKN